MTVSKKTTGTGATTRPWRDRSLRFGVMTRCILLLIFAVATAGGHDVLASGKRAAKATPAEKAKTVRLLTVGNSFSQNATRFLGDLVAAAGNVLIHHQAVIGGAT